ncbi:hypothetical protein H2198_003741 [Neophaeococcomyces mojaviensis]|uniref:Uncharacterized protein n=1 Tax=Neophaeococcomyces mojaviensis TaxID=3383035 RepID=A0ACC3AAD9_9EURO|nr:hypothetical protein H2198_003741 [Knufia sp. JES_112]
MTITVPIYSLPLPASSHNPSQASRKRKRRGHIEDAATEDGYSTQEQSEEGNIEYTAVLTPDERTQRRLAGQPLDSPPPPFPFPHASLRQVYPPKGQLKNGITGIGDKPTTTPDETHVSLRAQHLAAMTSALHKCLMQKDFRRASRALALILRTEVAGSTVDIRQGGLWGAGAEALLQGNMSDVAMPISRKNFERVKTFYDKLALQYPWQRRWPNITNAQDFKSAMFALWIYTACAESKRLQNVDETVQSDMSHSPSRSELRAKRWELSEAERIAQEMDTLMSTIPFIDHLDLIRLRGMVALWVAGLVEALDLLEAESESNRSMQDQDMHSLWLTGAGVDEHEAGLVTLSNKSSQKADHARDLASNMFAKLRDRDEYAHDDSGNESNISSTYS